MSRRRSPSDEEAGEILEHEPGRPVHADPPSSCFSSYASLANLAPPLQPPACGPPGQRGGGRSQRGRGRFHSSRGGGGRSNSYNSTVNNDDSSSYGGGRSRGGRGRGTGRMRRYSSGSASGANEDSSSYGAGGSGRFSGRGNRRNSLGDGNSRGGRVQFFIRGGSSERALSSENLDSFYGPTGGFSDGNNNITGGRGGFRGGGPERISGRGLGGRGRGGRGRFSESSSVLPSSSSVPLSSYSNLANNSNILAATVTKTVSASALATTMVSDYASIVAGDIKRPRETDLNTTIGIGDRGCNTNSEGPLTKRTRDASASAGIEGEIFSQGEYRPTQQQQQKPPSPRSQNRRSVSAGRNTNFPPPPLSSPPPPTQVETEPIKMPSAIAAPQAKNLPRKGPPTSSELSSITSKWTEGLLPSDDVPRDSSVTATLAVHPPPHQLPLTEAASFSQIPMSSSAAATTDATFKKEESFGRPRKRWGTAQPIAPAASPAISAPPEVLDHDLPSTKPAPQPPPVLETTFADLAGDPPPRFVGGRGIVTGMGAGGGRSRGDGHSYYGSRGDSFGGERGGFGARGDGGGFPGRGDAYGRGGDGFRGRCRGRGGRMHGRSGRIDSYGGRTDSYGGGRGFDSAAAARNVVVHRTQFADMARGGFVDMARGGGQFVDHTSNSPREGSKPLVNPFPPLPQGGDSSVSAPSPDATKIDKPESSPAAGGIQDVSMTPIAAPTSRDTAPSSPKTPPPTPSPEPSAPSGLVLALTRLASMEAELEYAYAKHMLLKAKQRKLRAQYNLLELLPVGIEAVQGDLDALRPQDAVAVAATSDEDQKISADTAVALGELG